MTRELKDGISRQGVDAEFEREEARVANLIIEARLLRHQGNREQAIARFAAAAEIEERLTRLCEEKGLTDLLFIHHFSAASCWAQARNFYDALRLCDELLAREQLPDRWRRRVNEFAETLRSQLAEWDARYAEPELEHSANP
jgi:hypothetical protein